MRKKNITLIAFCNLLFATTLLAQVQVFPVKINEFANGEVILGAFKPNLDKLLISPSLANYIQEYSPHPIQEIEGHHEEKGKHQFGHGCILILNKFQVGKYRIKDLKAYVTNTLNTPIDLRRVSGNFNGFYPEQEIAALEFGLLDNQLDLTEMMKNKAYMESNYKDDWPLSRRRDYYYLSDPPFPAKLSYAIYQNTRFGYTLFYPHEFLTPERGSENGDGMGLESEIFNATILSYGSLIMSEIDAEAEAVKNFNRFRSNNSGLDIQYSLVKDNWFVVSGSNDQGRIFYIKEVITGESILTLSILYPQEYKEVFDEVVRMNGKCFPNCAN